MPSDFAPTVATLNQILQRLRAAEAKEEAALKDLPRWMPYGFSADPGPPDSDTALHLRKILRDPGPTGPRALAALWIAARELPAEEDLDALSCLLDEDVDGISLPYPLDSQNACADPVVWSVPKLDDLARQSLQKLAGKWLPDRQSYEEWKAAAPEGSATVAGWREALRRCRNPGEASELLRRFEAQDPQLCVRVLICWDGKKLPITADEIVVRACAVTDPATLWKAYRGDPSWGDRFRAWLRRNALRIYDASRDPGFLKAWEEGGRQDPSLALGAAAFHQTRSVDILKTALDQVDSRYSPDPFYVRLLRDHFPGEWPYLRDQFWYRWTLTPDWRSVDIFFRELVAHPAGRPALRELLTDPRFDAASQRDLEYLVHFLEPVVDFPRRGEVWLSKYYYNAELAESIREEAFAKSREAARDCLARARAALQR